MAVTRRWSSGVAVAQVALMALMGLTAQVGYGMAPAPAAAPGDTAVQAGRDDRSMEVIERVLAVVGGRVITLSDVNAARAFGLVSEGGPFLDPTRGTLLALIERALILSEVDRYALTEPAEQTVAADVRAIRARFSSPDAFAGALDRTGLDESRLREVVRENERLRAYVNQRFPGVPLGDDELRRYFADHRDRFAAGAEFEEVRGLVVATAMAEQRRIRIDEWVAGLRARTDVTDLWVTTR